MGNTHYGGANDLKNPENDALAMARNLHELGFDVLICLDQTDRQMADDVDDFGAKAAGASVVVFYFSGHGSQIAGKQYLIPVGFSGHTDNDIRYGAVNVARVLWVLGDTKSTVNMVILDACRDNPFSRGIKSLTRGLAGMSAPSNTLIEYATSPGSTAEDNPDGANGLYTTELLAQMKAPGT